MTDAEYDLRPVEELSPAALAAVQRIYSGGFPPHQRASFAALTSERPPGERALALIRDGQPAGFAVLRLLGGTGWEYLRYFVVDAGQRVHRRGGSLRGRDHTRSRRHLVAPASGEHRNGLSQLQRNDMDVLARE